MRKQQGSIKEQISSSLNQTITIEILTNTEIIDRYSESRRLDISKALHIKIRGSSGSKRSVKLEILKLQLEAQLRKEEREAQLRKEEREHEAQLRREEAQLKREEQEREAQLRREERELEARLKQQEVEANKEV
ncbi:arginine and glutamate-rich protein 1-A-like [Procambarus clarkii]|uniref:arginine and glutamate-rich protein 1-A-like n=1 Tax=Procambarus clarkii TaxID=6728 RepID=UPI003743D60C